MGMKAMHGSRNVIITGNQFVKNSLWAIGLMPGAASHEGNTDGGSIIAHNLISDFGHGDAHWIWGDERSPFKFDTGQEPMIRRSLMSSSPATWSTPSANPYTNTPSSFLKIPRLREDFTFPATCSIPARTAFPTPSCRIDSLRRRVRPEASPLTMTLIRPFRHCKTCHASPARRSPQAAFHWRGGGDSDAMRSTNRSNTLLSGFG